MTHPAIRDLFESLGRNVAYQELLRLVSREGSPSISFSGLTTTAKAIYLVLLAVLPIAETLVIGTFGLANVTIHHAFASLAGCRLQLRMLTLCRELLCGDG